MSKINRYLLTSMVTDVKEVVNVTNEICSCIENVDYPSWRYPTKLAMNIDAISIMERHKGSAGELYILVMEMIYDRMQFVLRLVLKFMDTCPFIQDFPRELGNGESFENVTLGKAVRILWCKLKFIPRSTSRNVITIGKSDNDAPVDFVPKGCQVSGSLSCCESCSYATKAIADLMSIVSASLRDNELPSDIHTERQKVRSDMFATTQWSAVTKFVEAIKSDLAYLLNWTSAVRSECKNDLREKEKVARSAEIEREILRTENKTLKMNIEQMSRDLSIANARVEILNANNVELMRKNLALTESLSLAEQKASDTQNLLRCNLQQTVRIVESKKELERSVRNLSEKLNSNSREFSIDVQKLRNTLNEIRNENSLSRMKYEEQIESLEQEVAKKKAKIARFVTNVHGSAEPPTTEEPSHVPNPKSDPESDMAKQLTSNEVMIEKLTRQNERLSVTLSRLKDHRRLLRVKAT